MGRLKKKLDETDLVYSDLFDDDDTIEDKYLIKEDERKKKHQHLLALVAGLLAVGIIVTAFVISTRKSDEDSKVTNNNTESIAPEATTQGSELVADKYPEITELITMYYDAKLKGDTNAIAKFVDNLEEVDMNSINATNKYVKKYKNIECYTKPGLEENTYVVFVYYEIKFKNIDTTAPSIDILYVIRDPDTSLVYIHNGATANNEIKNYILAMENEPDVSKLCEDTNKALQEAIKSDSNLEKLFEDFKAKSDNAQDETETAEETTSKKTKKKTKKSESATESETEASED